MFGFTPEESLVVLHLLESKIEFSLRMDAEALQAAPEQVLDYLEGIGDAGHRIDGRWVLLLYVEDPDSHLLGLEHLERHLPRLESVLVTDGQRSWEFLDAMLWAREGYDARSSAVVAQAVWDGQCINASRQEALAPLAVAPASGEHADEARRSVASVESAGDRLELLKILLEGGVVSDEDCAVIGLLLAEEECLAEMLSQLSVRVAAERFALLLRVREQTPEEGVVNVVALAAMAGWLSGGGAVMTECLVELERLDPRHPVVGIIHTMQRYAIPPSVWDE